jgi:hypothetical protein
LLGTARLLRLDSRENLLANGLVLIHVPMLP